MHTVKQELLCVRVHYLCEKRRRTWLGFLETAIAIQSSFGPLSLTATAKLHLQLSEREDPREPRTMGTTVQNEKKPRENNRSRTLNEKKKRRESKIGGHREP